MQEQMDMGMEDMNMDVYGGGGYGGPRAGTPQSDAMQTYGSSLTSLVVGGSTFRHSLRLGSSLRSRVDRC